MTDDIRRDDRHDHHDEQSHHHPDDGEQYFYDLATGEVQRGKVAGWTNRMGPYPSEEAAREAMQRVRERNEEWEEEDQAWSDDA